MLEMNTMFNSGPWKWIILLLVIVSQASTQVQVMKGKILSYNLLVGLTNDFFPFAEDISKVRYMR
jgi:hypothetical protein